jgi:hypothetical protein
MARRTKQEIAQILKQYRERGGVTRQEFCESRGISLSTLGYYVRRHGRGTPAVKLARVTIQAPEPAPFALVLLNGRRIECGAEALATLLRIAERG